MMILRKIERRLELFVKSAWAERHLFKALLALLLIMLVLALSLCGCTGPCKAPLFSNLGAHGAAFHYGFTATHVLPSTGAKADIPYGSLADPLDRLVAETVECVREASKWIDMDDESEMTDADCLSKRMVADPLGSLGECLRIKIVDSSGWHWSENTPVYQLLTQGEVWAVDRLAGSCNKIIIDPDRPAYWRAGTQETDGLVVGTPSFGLPLRQDIAGLSGTLDDVEPCSTSMLRWALITRLNGCVNPHRSPHLARCLVDPRCL